MRKGHNSIDRHELKAFVDRLEMLNTNKQAVMADIRQTMLDAKKAGLDARTLRDVLSYRAQDQEAIREREDLRRMYLEILGN